MQVFAVFGPTGVGKTAVAIALADALRERGEDPVAVSADSMQIYAGLPILTGAADAQEQGRLEHRLLGFVPIDQTYSAGAFAQRAHAEIDGLIEQGRRPIVVGGTGLYLRAALAELDLRPPVDPAIREALAARDLAELYAELPPELNIRPTDTHRIIRAHELLATGQHPHTTSDQLWTEHTRHPTLLAALVMDRERLYARIEARIDAMIAAGAADEVRAVADRASATARRAVGFQELLDGDVEAMKTSTRRYAKRQLTWLRKLPGAHRIDVTDRTPQDVAAELIAMI
ncbi:tRNA (adenosine(37)-N6)-dimethylallyltransferase MiaA [Solirubrobacter sp. CPCC 204708]|uniref:tRNA dimethylallyltransferase n=1 Tax=Solirubrobacter deserti TaxID=2282478 RepID=A0ABT4RHJ3_9ACTN|nr:tRNA (adenosine(37)-N6)-dimethylallyltransferase MiaA [Solirubrobacter deserti]MBE2315311.1 tRNA (adenosine(37)-N6)-dimethylallyltransferase MiaA [Solirubrobacter deserti]MDA0137996.1 tRNA (adenosine(37)-N6)-dimethylallyltransferase MiaA [Solirubrobacter deserti]